MEGISVLAKIWLFVFVSMYCAYCIFGGVKGALRVQTAADYFITGRKIPVWIFVLAATATSFSGWTFIGHPGLIFQHGFQYAYASLYAITIPFTGILFMKRQWVLGKRFGYVTPGEMFSEYYQSDVMRILTIVVALVFSVPYMGIQLRAAGFLFQSLTGGAMAASLGMLLLTVIVILYVACGGLLAVAYVDTAQCVLMAIGITLIGLLTLSAVGGWSALSEGLGRLTSPQVVPALGGPVDQIRTTAGYSHFVAMPGVMHLVKDGSSSPGGAWTGMMCLTYMFALMGIQASPAFSMWAFANQTPKPFAPQQVWASSLGIGLILVFMSPIQGIAGHLLGADPKMLEAGYAVDALHLGGDIMRIPGGSEMIVPSLISLFGRTYPWLLGFLAVCAIAAMQSTGAAYISSASATVTRDLYKRYFNRTASHAVQKFVGRLAVILITASSFVFASSSTDAIVLVGGLAVAYSLQLWPALIGTCWWPWLTKEGVSVGLIAGLIAVTLTESIGQQWFGISAWGRWPLTIHSAGWGILLNFLCVILISAFTQRDSEREHKMRFHFFGNPNNQKTWLFGMPSIWLWQVVWWLLGVAMMWFLAYKMQLSTMPEKEIIALLDDVGDRK
ncbi:MAG: sodium:solute symporter family protein [Deltaproteobacteria bacterium]